MTEEHKKRILIFNIAISLVLVIFIYKLFTIQVINHEKYLLLSDRQFITNTDTLFDRGSIYFTDKNGIRMSAAGIKTGYKVAIIPRDVNITEKEYYFTKLHSAVGLTREKFDNAFKNPKDSYEELLTKISKEDASKVKTLKLKALRVYVEKWRAYPGKSLGSQMIGFISDGEDGQNLGRYGLEREYEPILSRKNKNLYINFFAEMFSDITSLFEEEKGYNGDLTTSIEPNVQIELANVLSRIMTTWNAESASGVIMDPRTGEIYALDSSPNYDPNNFRLVSDYSTFMNPIVEGVYEMGSIVKPIIMAIAIDTHGVSAGTKYFDKGYVEVSDRTIRNYDKLGRGWVTMYEVLVQSLNTGMVFAVSHVDKSKLKNYLEKFGLFEKTGIDLPNEGKTITQDLSFNNEVAYANMSFGQGIAVSPISIIRAMSVIANGGFLITPHIVKSISYANGMEQIIDYPYKNTGSIIEDGTQQTIIEMMRGVSDVTLKKFSKVVKDYTIAAKTGTAQIPHPNGGYYTDRNMHSLIGFFPSTKPRFIMYMNVRYPKGAKFSAETLGEPFMYMAQYLLNYYKVEPDRKNTVDAIIDGKQEVKIKKP